MVYLRRMYAGIPSMKGARRAAILMLLLRGRLLALHRHIGHRRVGRHTLTGRALVDERGTSGSPGIAPCCGAA